ncbi:1,3-beta-D-glucan synthase, partial [Cladochytrium tenue]
MLWTLVCAVAVKLTYTPCTKITDSLQGTTRTPANCVEVDALLDWFKQAIFSIIAVFAINFLPLFAQVLSEQGPLPAAARVLKHVASLGPLFELRAAPTGHVVTDSQTLLSDLSFGRAAYISSGRAVATSRAPFRSLYAEFAQPSVYLGLRLLIALIACSSLAGFPHLAFLWMMVLPLVLAPWIFNPHQFLLSDFLLDYLDLIRWFTRGNALVLEAPASRRPPAPNSGGGGGNAPRMQASVDGPADSWVAFHRNQRAQFTGHARRSRVEGHPLDGLARAK